MCILQHMSENRSEPQPENLALPLLVFLFAIGACAGLVVASSADSRSVKQGVGDGRVMRMSGCSRIEPVGHIPLDI